MQLHRQFGPHGRRAPALAATLVAGFLVACSPTVENYGHIPDPEIVKSVRVGSSNREQVQAMLGTPTAISTFDKESWYYIGSRVSRLAFFTQQWLRGDNPSDELLTT